MEGAAQSLLGNASQLLSSEYQLLSGVGGEVAELRDDMATMNALLRMQSEAEEGAVDHFLREWMKQLRELAYDAEDCAELYRLRIKSRPGDGVRARVARLFGTLLGRRRLANEISALRARAVAIGERHARYGINREALRRSPRAPAPPLAQATSLPENGGLPWPAADHHRLVGIEAQADDFIRLLRMRDDSKRLQVFSIVGFGGLGKTTLAMEVCRRLAADFQCQAMVSVSQAFDPSRDLKPLLKRLLQLVVEAKTENERGIKEEQTLGDIGNMDTQQLTDKLKECVDGKRYLVVIDDVWTMRAWEAIQSVLPENYLDSRIIVTTRIETVAKACSPAVSAETHIHRMKPLNDEDATKLFLSRAFGSMDYSCPEDLKDVMDKILAKCSGLPLAIVTIASVLASYRRNKDMWEILCKSIGSQMESNPSLEWMRHILSLSYNHLPHELKGCMMYLSIFPEDYEIDKARLLYRWIAEGLVQEKRGMTLMEVAESYFDELQSRNMLEAADFFSDDYFSDGSIMSCRVHDMLLEVMVSKSLESNFVSLLGEPYAGVSYDNRVRRLSIQGDDRRLNLDDDDDEGAAAAEQGKHADKKKKKKKKKRTAGRRHGIVVDGVDVQHVRSLSMFQLPEHIRLLDHLHKFTLLRVLDLEDCKGVTNKHVRHICRRLCLLKFLSLKDTNISVVPQEVGNLEHLQVLDVRGTILDIGPHSGLSEAVTNLRKLERLLFSGLAYFNQKWPLPKGLGKMKALREVGVAILHNDAQIAREFGELQQLEDLWLRIELDRPGEPAALDAAEDVVREFAKSLCKMYSLRRLVLDGEGTDTLRFLHDLSTPPRLLRHLMILGQVGESLPTWFASLTHLTEFRMFRSFLRGDHLFDALCDLPSLKIMFVGVRCYTDDALVARQKHKFRSLVSLNVSAWTRRDPRTFEFEAGSMPMLERFAIFFLDDGSERNTIGLQNLTSLKEVRVHGPKGDTALENAVLHLKSECAKHPNHNELQVVVKYD